MERNRESLQPPMTCGMVEKILAEKLEALKERVTRNAVDILHVQQDVEGRCQSLWEELRQGQTSLATQLARHADELAKHAKEDRDALNLIERQLLNRVPAWALAVITVAGSIIGAMATFIMHQVTPLAR